MLTARSRFSPESVANERPGARHGLEMAGYPASHELGVHKSCKSGTELNPVKVAVGQLRRATSRRLGSLRLSAGQVIAVGVGPVARWARTVRPSAERVGAV